jgi:DNA-binding CsgD family transcriptional regulator
MGRPAKEWVDRLAGVAGRANGASLPERSLRSLYAYVAASTATQTADDVARFARSSIMPFEPSDPPILLQTTGAGLAMSGSLVEALGVLDRALEVSRELGDVVQFGFVSETRSWVAHRAGRVLECEADARAGLAVAVDGALDLPYAVACLGIPLIERGELSEAAALFAEHGLDTTTDIESALAASLFGVRGRLHYALGRPHEAIADAERCQDVLTQAGFTSPTFIEWPMDLVLAHLALGEHDAAREVAAEDLAVSRAFGAPREIGIALRSMGLAEGRRGLDLLAESVDVLSASEAHLDHAKSLVEHGAALRRAGRRAEARDQLSRGLDEASRCGGLAVVARARDELHAAGARPRRERLSGPDALTASELRVARLAVEGRSNPEIAQALFVTRRTVEFHLTNAYRKLDIDSREALAEALGRPD